MVLHSVPPCPAVAVMSQSKEASKSGSRGGLLCCSEKEKGLERGWGFT